MNFWSSLFAVVLAAAFFRVFVWPAFAGPRTCNPLTRLNIRVGSAALGWFVYGDHAIMLLTQKLPLSIAPSSAGNPVDLAAFPTALTDITWSVAPTDAGTLNTTTPDLTNCEFKPTKSGDSVVTVSGKNSEGNLLSESFDVNVAVPVPVVDALNLKAGDPIAA